MKKTSDVGITVRIDTPPKPEKPVRKARKKKEPVVVTIPTVEEVTTQYRQLLDQANHSELAELCRLAGYRVDRSISAEELREVLLTGDDSKHESSYVWEMRDKIQHYLDTHPNIKVDPRVCPRDCSQHPDLIVLQCYNVMASAISVAKSSDIAAVTKQRVANKRKRSKNP